MAQAKQIEDQNSFQAEPSVLDLGPFRRALALVASGLTVAEGQARLDREDRRLREERKRRRLERHRAVALRDGEDDPALSRADLKALADADAVEAKAKKGQRGAPAIRERAARMRAKVGADVKARGEARRADLRLAQTVDLDAVREGVEPGQVLDRKFGKGMPRLKTRDGLVMLHESGTLSQHLLAVGLRYRAWYEVTQASLKSCLEVSDKAKGAVTTWSQCRAAQRRAALANRVRTMEAAVATQLHPDALEALRLIAGEARTVNSISKSARKRERLAQGLALALAIVADNLPEAR